MLFRPRATTKEAAIKRDPRRRCSSRRFAGGADETRRRSELIYPTIVSSDPTKSAAPRRTSQRAEEHWTQRTQ